MKDGAFCFTALDLNLELKKNLSALSSSSIQAHLLDKHPINKPKEIFPKLKPNI